MKKDSVGITETHEKIIKSEKKLKKQNKKSINDNNIEK